MAFYGSAIRNRGGRFRNPAMGSGSIDSEQITSDSRRERGAGNEGQGSCPAPPAATNPRGLPFSARRRASAARRAGVRASRVCAPLAGGFDHDRTAAFAALGAEVDDPVGRGDHVEVVLDHDQRMPGLQQLVEGAEQLGDVLEVQAGGGLSNRKSRPGSARSARRPRPGCSASPARQVRSPCPQLYSQTYPQHRLCVQVFFCAASARWPASFRRCASPPDSVGTGWPRRR